LGPKAEFKVWIAIDGDTAYIDRNGNGDLTEEGESLHRFRSKRGGIDRLHDVDLAYSLPGVKRTSLYVWWVQLEQFTGGSVEVLSDGRHTQMCGWHSSTDWKYAPSPDQAAVIHFGSNVVTVRPALRKSIADREWSRPAVPDANKETRVYFEVGTPGVGTGNGLSSSGSFAWFRHSSLVHKKWPFQELVPENPVAEYEFTPLNSGEPVKKVRVELTERIEGTLFCGMITVPEGVTTGLDAAKVTLSYPNCPWGKVEPVTYTVDVIPRR
jgi:hypothetical protein